MLPGERGRGIGSWLAAWTEQRATSLGSSRVGQVAPDGSLPQRLLRGRGYTLGHTSWVLELPEGREVPQRPLPAGYTLATADTAERERAAYVVIQDAFDEWEGRVRDHLRGLGRDDRAPPRCAAVAAAGRRARRGGRRGLVHHPGQPGRRATCTSSPSSGRTAGRGWPRRCSPTRSRGPASRVRPAASCRPTHAPGRSTSTSRSAWRSPRSGRTWSPTCRR